MILYVNGDSHTAGAGVASEKTYASKLAKYYNLKLYNDAARGASNTKIIRTTKEFLDKNPTVELMIIIGWSGWEREEWEYQGRFYNINSAGYDQLPEALKEQYKQWVLAQTPELLNSKSNEWHEKIYSFHCELIGKKIPHLFFNCMYNFFNVVEHKKINWNLQYVHPYENDYSYYWYLAKQGYATDGWYHFDELGHQAWADFLIDYITENNVL